MLLLLIYLVLELVPWGSHPAEPASTRGTKSLLVLYTLIPVVRCGSVKAAIGLLGTDCLTAAGRPQGNYVFPECLPANKQNFCKLAHVTGFYVYITINIICEAKKSQCFSE